MPALTRRRSTERRQQKITLGEMRASGVRGLLIYCSDYRCSHSTAISGDRWPDDVRLSELENAFSRCQRPKNSHSRMITGIGTPSSQSKMPRPIVSSINFLVNRERSGETDVPVKLLPVAGVGHRGPGLGGWLGIALLQQLDRMFVRRADERHHAVARRSVDDDARLH